MCNHDLAMERERDNDYRANWQLMGFGCNLRCLSEVHIEIFAFDTHSIRVSGPRIGHKTSFQWGYGLCVSQIWDKPLETEKKSCISRHLSLELLKIHWLIGYYRVMGSMMTPIVVLAFRQVHLSAGRSHCRSLGSSRRNPWVAASAS